MIKPVLNLMLGTACNKHCSYCMQPRHGSNGKIDIDQFIEKLISYLKVHCPNGLYTIEYWGGEPLLYFDYIKSIQEALVSNSIYIERKPRIVTNGTLIHQDFIDFCNQYDILVNLSWHDGSITDEQLIKFLQINNIYVTSVITHQHLTLESDYTGWSRIADLGRIVKWQVYPVHCTDHCSKDSYLTIEDINCYFKYLARSILPNKDLSTFNKYILNHLYVTYIKHKAITVEPKCYGARNLSIDLHGNRYYCHHVMEASNIAYNIFDAIPIINANDSVAKYFSSKECQSCELLPTCLGSCYLSNRHQEECYWVKRAYRFCKEFEDEIQN